MDFLYENRYRPARNPSSRVDWKISALCGYGRYCHEGNNEFTRSCKGRNCECWCHKKYLVEEKSVPLKYSWTSDIRDQTDDVVCLIKTT